MYSGCQKVLSALIIVAGFHVCQGKCYTLCSTYVTILPNSTMSRTPSLLISATSNISLIFTCECQYLLLSTKMGKNTSETNSGSFLIPFLNSSNVTTSWQKLRFGAFTFWCEGIAEPLKDLKIDLMRNSSSSLLSFSETIKQKSLKQTNPSSSHSLRTSTI